MAEDDSAVERSPADIRAEFRETCARITGNVNELESRVRAPFEAVAHPRRSESTGTISELGRITGALKASGAKPLLVAGAAAGFIAMRWWSRERRGSRNVTSAPDASVRRTS